MNQANIPDIPKNYEALIRKSDEIGFTMPSDRYIGTLLKTLVASKPNGNFLELGTGIGLSLSWMIDGMCESSSLTTVDNDANLVDIVNAYFGTDSRIKLICEDAAKWISSYHGKQFDLIFADAWPGKYSDLEKTLDLVAEGGYYVIDDMNYQKNWPEGHENHVAELVQQLENNNEFTLTKMDWSTGVILAVKKTTN